MTMKKYLTGKLSPQYKAIQQNIPSLTGRLKSNEGTRSNLIDKLSGMDWFLQGASETPRDLINLVLEKIERKATNYDQFIDMLEQAGGAEDIVEILLGDNYSNGFCCSLYSIHNVCFSFLYYYIQCHFKHLGLFKYSGIFRIGIQTGSKGEGGRRLRVQPSPLLLPFH